MHDTLQLHGTEPDPSQLPPQPADLRPALRVHENFILPLCHDEVVHGKGSLLGRCRATAGRSSPTCAPISPSCGRIPGKKLLFMGGEFGQEREWNHDASLDWHLLDDRAQQRRAALGARPEPLYRTRRRCTSCDCEPEGFAWIDAADGDESVLSYVRRGRDPD